MVPSRMSSSPSYAQLFGRALPEFFHCERCGCLHYGACFLEKMDRMFEEDVDATW